MKNSRISYLLLCLLLTGSCSEDRNLVPEDRGPAPVEAQVYASVAVPQLKATGSQWNSDVIGILATHAPSGPMPLLYRNVRYATSSTSASAHFFPSPGKGILFGDNDVPVTFAAYAPYQASEPDVLPGNQGRIPVNTSISNSTSEQESIDFLYASGAVASLSSPKILFMSGESDSSFKHRMARIEILLQCSAADGFSPSEILDPGTSCFLGGLKHEGTFDMTSGIALPDPDAEPLPSWNITSCKELSGLAENTKGYALILLPQDCSSAPLDLSISIGGQVYSNKTAIHPDLKPGHSYRYNVVIRKKGLMVRPSEIKGWEDAFPAPVEGEIIM